MFTKRTGLKNPAQHKGVLKLSSIAELVALRNNVRTFQPRPYILSLQVPQLSPQQNRTWQERLNQNLSACGCNTSAAFLLVALASCLVISFTQLDKFNDLKWPYAVAMLLAIILCSLAGKLIGLAIAHIRAKRHITELIRMLESNSVCA